VKPEANPGSGQSVPASLLALLSRHSDKLLAVVPFAYLVWVVAGYGVAVPYWDQWDLVPLLDKMYRGGLTLSDLWAQHNEHRPLVPQVIMLGLARLTGWNIRYELGVNVALAFGVFAVLACQIRATGRTLAVAGLRWAIPVSSLIVFSISQYQNWLWGWQIQMLLNMLAVVGGIVVLAQPAFTWPRFAASALLGILATYSFANGVLFWPIGLGILLVVTHGRKERKAGIAAWVLVSLLTLASYFWHYQKPAAHPSLSLVLKMPLAYVSYVIKYIGSICAQYSSWNSAGDGDLAFVFGLLGVAALGWAGWMVVRRKLARPEALLPYFAMSAYSIGSALMTGLGRVGFGSDQALASRYCTTTAPLWVSLIVLLVLLASRGGEQWRSAGPADYRAIVAGLLLVGATGVLAMGSLCATEGAGNMSRVQEYGRTSLLDLAAHPGAEIDYTALTALGPNTNGLVQWYPVLVKNHLAVFHKGS
jgi:hypothetical protein